MARSLRSRSRGGVEEGRSEVGPKGLAGEIGPQARRAIQLLGKIEGRGILFYLTGSGVGRPAARKERDRI